MKAICDFCKVEKNGVTMRYDPIMKKDRLLCNNCSTFKAKQFWELNPEKKQYIINNVLSDVRLDQK